MPLHLLTNFEIQKYYKNETKLNGVYSRKSLPKIKDGAYAINLDEYKSAVCINQQMYVNGDNGSLSYNAFYFDSFGEEHIPKVLKILAGNKNIITKIWRIQAYNSVISGYFCIGFIDFMLKGKILSDYQSLFLLTNLKKMIKIILKYFQ